MSIWELRLKQSLGKLELPSRFRESLELQPFVFLDVTPEHAHAVAGLPWLHRDPFDRLLIAQARCERLTVVTRDERLSAYDVSVLAA